jgi:hypothetical protein
VEGVISNCHSYSDSFGRGVNRFCMRGECPAPMQIRISKALKGASRELQFQFA